MARGKLEVNCGGIANLFTQALVEGLLVLFSVSIFAAQRPFCHRLSKCLNLFR